MARTYAPKAHQEVATVDKGIALEAEARQQKRGRTPDFLVIIDDIDGALERVE
jgi:hypothetical protein